MNPAADSRGRWSHEVIRGLVAGKPCLMFRHHPPTVAALLADGQRWGSRVYLAQGDRRIDYQTHEAAARRLAGHLSVLGVGPRSPIALTGHASPEWVTAFWASQLVGAIAVPCSPWWNNDYTEEVLARTDAKVIIGNGVGRHRDVVTTEEVAVISREEGAIPGLPALSVDQEDPAVVLFTAGTTGEPKGVVLSQRSVVAGVQNMLSPRRLLPPDLPDDHVGPVSLVTLPLFHIGGITTIVSNLLCGGRMIFPAGRFDPSEVLDLIDAEQVTTWGAIPTMVYRVVAVADERVSGDLTSLRSLIMGGAAVPNDLLERVRRVFTSVRNSGNTYGLTEAGGHVATATSDEAAAYPGCSGRPLPAVEISIADHPSALGGEGEIRVRSASTLIGYWGEKDSPVDAEGWLDTGDLGWVDNEGRLWVTGRIKDLIIRGGENIAPSRIEDRLREHPDVHDVAVVGLSHDDLGEEVGAVIVVSDPRLVTVEHLREHAHAVLSYYEVPSRWWLRSEPLPVNPTGKVLKRELIATWPEP